MAKTKVSNDFEETTTATMEPEEEGETVAAPVEPIDPASMKPIPQGFGTDLLVLSPGDIVVDHSRNLRRFAPDAKYVEGLAKNIMARGQIQPVGVVALGGDSGVGYQLVFGFQRVAAIQYANDNLGAKLGILARVLPATAGVITNLDENLRRKELSYMDVAYAISYLKEHGMAMKDIAENFGKTRSWAAQVQKFINFRPALQKKLEDGTLPFSLARMLVDAEEKEQDNAIAELEAGMSQAEVKAKTDATRTKKKTGRKTKEEKSGAPSLKKVTAAFEELSEKSEDANDMVRGVAGIVLKFIQGKLGLQAVRNQLAKLA